MWGSSDYGNFGGGKDASTGGGGFLNTSAVSPVSQDKKKPERLTNVAACTIKQILKMPDGDENLRIGSMTARIVTFVGIVRSVDVQSTKITYLIDDMTGPCIEAQIWLGENEDGERKTRNIQENTYARITGAVRSMKGKRHVIAFKIAPLTEANELTMHILEVIHTAMAIAAMDQQQTTQCFGGSSAFPAKTESAMQNQPSFGGGGVKESFVLRGLSKPQQIVLQAISASNDPQGASIHDLYNNIKTLNRQAVSEAVEFLSNNGHIYSTIDEDHFKSIEAD